MLTYVDAIRHCVTDSLAIPSSSVSRMNSAGCLDNNWKSNGIKCSSITTATKTAKLQTLNIATKLLLFSILKDVQTTDMLAHYNSMAAILWHGCKAIDNFGSGVTLIWITENSRSVRQLSFNISFNGDKI